MKNDSTSAATHMHVAPVRLPSGLTVGAAYGETAQEADRRALLYSQAGAMLELLREISEMQEDIPVASGRAGELAARLNSIPVGFL